MKDAKQFTKDKAQKCKNDKFEKSQSYATAISLKNLNPMQLQQQNQHLPVPPKRMIMMRRNLINMIS
jgi:hypothetical protein